MCTESLNNSDKIHPWNTQALSDSIFGWEQTLASVHWSKGVGITREILTCSGAVTGGTKLKKLMGINPRLRRGEEGLDIFNCLQCLLWLCKEKEIHWMDIQNCVCILLLMSMSFSCETAIHVVPISCFTSVIRFEDNKLPSNKPIMPCCCFHARGGVVG